MPKKLKGVKKVTTTTSAVKKEQKQTKNPLFESKPRNFRIGGSIQPKRDLTRFVKWPKYIRLQRQKRILLDRLKVPPSLNQFTKTLEKNQATQLFKLLTKYAPENRIQKRERLAKQAQQKVEAGSAGQADTKRPVVLKYGLNHITTLVENRKAKLVVIAHDVDPIELVIFLPTLCRKQGVPFVFIKGKARLGKLVHKKTATAVAITDVNKEDVQDLENLAKNARSQFNENKDLLRKWGGGLMGIKAQHKQQKREKLIQEELSKRVAL